MTLSFELTPPRPRLRGDNLNAILIHCNDIIYTEAAKRLLDWFPCWTMQTGFWTAEPNWGRR